MKRTCLFLVIPLIAVMVIGCASSGGSSGSSGSAKSQEADSDDPPDWFLNPPATEDVIYGAGTAKMSDLNKSLTMAESRARQSISFTLNANVQAMITDYFREAGNSETKSNLDFAESIGRQLTNSQLQGATVYRRAKGKDGTVYCLVALRKADAAKAAAQIVDSEASKYAEFKAMNALEAMEAQLAKTNIKPQSINE